MLLKLLNQCLLFLFEVKVDRTLSDGRLVHLLGREVRRLLLVPLLMHLDLQGFIVLLESLAPVLLFHLKGTSHLIINLPGILHLPESLLHLPLPLGPLDLLHVAVTHGLLELMLPQLAVLHVLLLLISLLEVDVIGDDLLKLLLLNHPLLTLLDVLLYARHFHKLALLESQLCALVLLLLLDLLGLTDCTLDLLAFILKILDLLLVLDPLLLFQGLLELGSPDGPPVCLNLPLAHLIELDPPLLLLQVLPVLLLLNLSDLLALLFDDELLVQVLPVVPHLLMSLLLLSLTIQSDQVRLLLDHRCPFVYFT